MNDFVYKITLDLNCSKTPPVICSGQFDKGRKFEFTITANGEPYDVTGCSAVLKGVRTNGSHFAVECTVSGGKIIKTLDDATLSVRGKTVAKLVISDSSKSYSTQMFIIDVDSSLDGDITIADDYSILNRLIEQIHALNESGAILVDDTIDENSSNAVANKAVTKALAIKANQTTATVLFNDEKIPIKLSNATALGAGFATNNNDIVTAFISNNVTVVQGGAFYGCSNLTDVYINNVSENIAILSDAIPDTATIHFTDGFNVTNYLIEAVLAAKNIIDKKADITTTYTKTEVDDALSGKLDNTAGSVTTDNIASKAVTSDKIANGAITALKIANGAVSGSNIAQNQISTNHLQSGAVTTDKLADEVKESINSKADKATTLAGYGINDAYTKDEVDNELAAKSDLVQSKNIFDFDTWAKGLRNLNKPVYNGTLDVVDFDEKSITFTSTGTSTFTNGWVDEPAEMRIAVKSNTVYTFSWLFENSTNNRIFLFFNGQNTAETRLNEVGSKAFLTFTTPEDASYITIRFDSYNQNIAAKVSNIMLEEGDKKSLYLPYEVAEGVKELAKSTETAISDMTGNTDTALEAKYDASNVETGIGSLTPYTSSTDIVKSADFTYQRVGRVVTVNVNIVFNEGTNSQVMFTNLPYVCKNTVNPRELCVSTAKTTRIWAINKNNTMLNIFSDSSVSYADGETLAFTLSYLIS